MAEDIGIEPISPFLNESLANSCRTLQHIFQIGAGNRVRTCDLNVGNVLLYQLSYTRISLVRSRGFEPLPHGFVDQDIIQLCYERIKFLAPYLGNDPS